MPPTVVTDDLALGAWWWARGLTFVQCAVVDAPHAEFTFADPDGRAPQLTAQFRRERELLDFLGARRRLLFAARLAEVTENGVATREDLNRSTRHVRPALADRALGRARAAGRAGVV